MACTDVSICPRCRVVAFDDGRGELQSLRLVVELPTELSQAEVAPSAVRDCATQRCRDAIFCAAVSSLMRHIRCRYAGNLRECRGPPRDSGHIESRRRPPRPVRAPDSTGTALGRCRVLRGEEHRRLAASPPDRLRDAPVASHQKIGTAGSRRGFRARCQRAGERSSPVRPRTCEASGSSTHAFGH